MWISIIIVYWSSGLKVGGRIGLVDGQLGGTWFAAAKILWLTDGCKHIEQSSYSGVRSETVPHSSHMCLFVPNVTKLFLGESLLLRLCIGWIFFIFGPFTTPLFLVNPPLLFVNPLLLLAYCYNLEAEFDLEVLDLAELDLDPPWIAAPNCLTPGGGTFGFIRLFW